MKTAKEAFKEMTISEKIAYLWEYYKVQFFLIVLAVAVVIYVIKEIITPDITPRFNAAIINSAVNPVTLEQYAKDFEDHLQLDPLKESVILNDNFYTDIYGLGSSSAEALVAYIAAGEIDVMIAPETSFKQYAYYGYFKKLSEALPTDIYTSLADYFFIYDQEEDPERCPYGIYLYNSDLFKGLKYNADNYVLGILINGQNTDNTIEFIRYLFKR
jgi:hypothetical protein